MLADLRTFILADGTVSGLIGNRFYASKAPQSPTKPYVTYQVISEVRGHVMDGPDGLPGTRVQIDAWAALPDDAISVSDAILARLDGYKGTMGATTVTQGIFADQQRSMYESEPELHRISRDYIVHHEE